MALVELVFASTLCHANIVSGAHFVLSRERATASTSTLVVRHTMVGKFADDSKQIAGRNQLCESHSAV